MPSFEEQLNASESSEQSRIAFREHVSLVMTSYVRNSLLFYLSDATNQNDPRNVIAERRLELPLLVSKNVNYRSLDTINDTTDDYNPNLLAKDENPDHVEEAVDEFGVDPSIDSNPVEDEELKLLEEDMIQLDLNEDDEAGKVLIDMMRLLMVLHKTKDGEDNNILKTVLSNDTLLLVKSLLNNSKESIEVGEWYSKGLM
ncbi:hypothetical protein C6P44_001788 [Monosporozyma unispora]|nr:hypothetical protein C6P44_001788 [Kazachstania unispora]